MSMLFDSAFEFVQKLEGGLSAHPLDRGGVTKYGITQRSYPQLDIAMLSLDEAKSIARRDFWDFCNCTALPWSFALMVFDTAFNQGPMFATRTLQNALRMKTTDVDGVIGSKTVRTAEMADVNDTLADYCAARAVRYITSNGYSTFGKGWFRRLFLVHGKCLTWRAK